MKMNMEEYKRRKAVAEIARETSFRHHAEMGHIMSLLRQRPMRSPEPSDEFKASVQKSIKDKLKKANDAGPD